MANIPGATWRIPGADSPYPIKITKGNAILLSTDNCGITFNVLGDKHTAAIAYIEYVLKDIERALNTSFKHRCGAINFVVKDRQIVSAEPVFTEYVEGVRHMPEDRPEVLEMVELIKSSLKSMMKMKAFW